MRLNEIDETSNYARDEEKFKDWIRIGQRVANSTEPGSGVDWRGEDELWNKAAALGNALTHLGQGNVKSVAAAFEFAQVDKDEDWPRIVELVKSAKKADFSGGDDEEQGLEKEQ